MILQRLKNDGIPELKLNGLQRQMKSQVEQKIKDKIYTFEEVNCAVCGSTSFDVIGEKDRYGFYYPTRICRDCGLVYTSPRMTQSSYNEFYNSEYRKLYGGTTGANELFFQRQFRHGAKIFEFLSSRNLLANSNRGLVLEVGCGAGGILEYFKRKGYAVRGIDLGEEYVNYGRDKHGLNLSTAFLKDINLETKPDVIIYSHVLEHVLDLEEEIKLIKQNAHEGTLVYIEVPGIKEIHKQYEKNILRYFQNAHTYHFTLTSLTNLLNKYGFSLIAGNEFVVSVFRMNKGEVIKRTNEYESICKYIQEQEKFRWLYGFTPTGLSKSIKRIALNFSNFAGIRPFLRSFHKKV